MRIPSGFLGLILDVILFTILISIFSSTLGSFLDVSNIRVNAASQETSVVESAINNSDIIDKEPKLVSKGFDELPKDLFINNKSQGFIAICAAEGNCYIGNNGTLTFSESYGQHKDPANFVTNYGGCSQQTPEPGLIGDAACLARFKRHQPKSIRYLNQYFGDKDLSYTEKVLLLYNTMDLFNQASPVHAPRFVEEIDYLINTSSKSIDEETIAIARTNAFYISTFSRYKGNYATGLISICQRENRDGSSMGINNSGNRYNMEYWDCVYKDQLRRVKQIDRTVRLYK